MRGETQPLHPHFDATPLKEAFLPALKADPGRADLIHAQWIKVGRSLLAGTRGDYRYRIVAGLYALDAAYAEFAAAGDVQEVAA